MYNKYICLLIFMTFDYLASFSNAYWPTSLLSYLLCVNFVCLQLVKGQRVKAASENSFLESVGVQNVIFSLGKFFRN